MEHHDFSKEEISAVKLIFPKLLLTEPDIWEGTIDFDAAFKEYRIIGSFKVKIKAVAGYPIKIPVAYDIGGRARVVADKHAIEDLRELHCNPKDDYSICLCVKQEEQKRFPPDSNLVNFIDDLVIPYYYGLEYYNDYGVWPWHEYSHGALGLFEYHANDSSERTKETMKNFASYMYNDDNLEDYRKLLRKPKKRPCVCGSGKFFHECHSLAWDGLLGLREDLLRLGLNPSKILFKRDSRGRLKIVS